LGNDNRYNNLLRKTRSNPNLLNNFLEKLTEYFCRYGEVTDCVVMKNAETGRSRGFGFVTFKDPSCVQIVMASGPHTLDGRTVSQH